MNSNNNNTELVCPTCGNDVKATGTSAVVEGTKVTVLRCTNPVCDEEWFEDVDGRLMLARDDLEQDDHNFDAFDEDV